MEKLLEEYNKLRHFYNLPHMENTYFKRNLDVVLNSELSERHKENILGRIEYLMNSSYDSAGEVLSDIASKIKIGIYNHGLYFRNNVIFNFNNPNFIHYCILFYDTHRQTKRIKINNGMIKCKYSHLLDSKSSNLKFDHVVIIEQNKEHVYKNSKKFKIKEEMDLIGLHNINELIF